MALILEGVRRADGRLALFHGDRCIGHLSETPASAVATPASAPANKPVTATTERQETHVAAPVRRHGVKKAVRRAPAPASDDGTRSRTAPLEAGDPRITRAQATLDAGAGLTAAARAAGVAPTTLYGWRQRGLLTFGASAPKPSPRARPAQAKRRPAPLVTGKRAADAPVRRTGPTLKDLATEPVEDGRRARLKSCPICGESTASRYCPNGHDIYLDAELDAGGGHPFDAARDDEDDDFD